MSETPVIQILEKEKYFNQHLISLPDAVPYPPLTTSSSVRVRSKVIGLTTNNLTYPKLGFLLGWWDIHPTPAGVPEPYNDLEKYGRTNCWGFAEVIESTHSTVPKGSYLWGYLPLGTLAQDLTLKDTEAPGTVVVTNERRKNAMSIYNRYRVYPASFGEQIERMDDAVAADIILKVMFETAYLLNRFAFAETSERRVHPGMSTDAPWGNEQADIAGATIIILAPGSKVGAAFASDVRHGRKVATVKRIIGAASEHSRIFVEDTGLYDEVVSTKDSPQEVLSRLHVGQDEKVVLLNFGGREGSGSKWASEISEKYENFVLLNIGSDLPGSTRQDMLKTLGEANPKAITPNASDMWERAIANVGEKHYSQEFDVAWEKFREAGGIKGLSYSWNKGIEEVGKGWDELCSGKLPTNKGLVYLL